MTTTVHHAPCCRSRVCLCICLGALLCTAHFHNCICCEKRSTYSHFRMWFINQRDSSQCTHSFISAVTFFLSNRLFFFYCFCESCDGSAYGFDIDGSSLKNNYFSKKMRLLLIQSMICGALLTDRVNNGCWKENTTEAQYLFNFLSWITENVVESNGSTSVCPGNFKVLCAGS